MSQKLSDTVTPAFPTPLHPLYLPHAPLRRSDGAARHRDPGRGYRALGALLSGVGLYAAAGRRDFGLGLDPRPVCFDEREQTLFDVLGPLEIKRIAFTERFLAVRVLLPCTVFDFLFGQGSLLHDHPRLLCDRRNFRATDAA